MKAPDSFHKHESVTSHYWVSGICILLGFGLLLAVALWIKRCKSTMFNMYQKINRQPDKDDKEPDVIGHDRFWQERPSRSSKRKKRITKRAQSVAEFSSATLSAASKRNAFKNRSQSSELKDSKEGSESFAKTFFSKNSWGAGVTRHEYSALRRGDSSGSEKQHSETQLYDANFITCRHFLSINNRYELNTQLERIGAKLDKHWFVIQDIALRAERLLSVVPLTSFCPIAPTESTRQTVLDLFRGLQHPYIHPVLDIEFWDTQVALVSPLNHTGSLRDLIHSSPWHEDFDNKYSGRGEGLPLWQIQRLGRQILEALLFIRERNFPPFYHLHSGNVILQNGVARLAGLENTLLGIKPRYPIGSNIISFGYLLFEMTSGYELPVPPNIAHLELEFERMPKVADVLRFIFENAKQPPCLEDLLRCDFFRGVELRELRGITTVQSQTSPDILQLLELVKPSSTTSNNRRHTAKVEVNKLEDILEEDEVEAEIFIKVER